MVTVGILLVVIFGVLWVLLAGPAWPGPRCTLRVPVSPERLRNDVVFLAGIKPSRNAEDTDAMARTIDRIRAVFIEAGLRVEEQAHGPLKKYRNIVASAGPEDGPRIIVGAHYDAVETTPGADDNASGVAGLLELARLIRVMQAQPRHRIDLAAYSTEEPPYFKTPFMGSAAHARSLAEAKVEVKAMISLEMIGFFSEQAWSQRFPARFLRLYYPSRGAFIGVVSNTRNYGLLRRIKRLMAAASDVPVYSISAPPFLPGIDFSDHRNFWRHGMPAVMVTDTAFYRNPNYHEPTDTPATLDYARMAEVVRGIYWAVVNL